MDDIDKLVSDIIGDNDAQQEVTMWLDTGYPPLNHAISGNYEHGGFPCGRIIEMFGPPSSGKTAIATSVMAAAQRAGGLAVFMDHENSFDVSLAVDIGLDPTTRWAYKQPETFEDAIDMTVKLARQMRGYDEKGKRGKVVPLPDDKPIVVVYDSLASMVPKSKMYDSKGGFKDAADYSMHDNSALARATSAAFPALAQMASKYNVCLVFLNQVRTKMGIVYGDATSTPGGQAPEFYASVRIALTREILKDKDKNVIGQKVNAYTKKNKVHPPFKRASWNFMFRADGTGYFDVDGSLVELLADNGVLERSGNGYIWTDGKKYMKPALKEKIEAEGLRDELMALLQGVEVKDELEATED